MIRITKPAQPPAILTTKGKAKRRGMSSAYTRFEQDYAGGIRRFDFESDIYAHESVKEALIDAQHGKCAFCESKILHIGYGDVEHFRPKAAYRQVVESPLLRPGYYWLAYEWENLFLSCQLCNQRYKRSLFALANPTERALSHRDDVHREQPLFIDPGSDEPEKYISFRREVPYSINDNHRGAATIKRVGLERTELSEIRYDRYEKLRLIYVLASADPPVPESADAQALLERAVQNGAEFAGMARAALASRFSIFD